jgi:CheY-like chemotaxis protein
MYESVPAPAMTRLDNPGTHHKGVRKHSAPSLAGSHGQDGAGAPGPAAGKDDLNESAGHFRVLIVEDEIALASQEKPDLVLMDIRLRGKRDGIEAALEIRQRFGIASVFATAHNEAEMRSRGAAAQPRAWLTKPYSDQQLLRAVKAALVRLD